MPDSQGVTRRRFLKGAAATATGASIAGCNSGNGPGDNNTGTDGTTEGPGTTTGEDGSIQLDIQNADIEIVWSPDMDQRQEVPEEHTAQATVSTSGGVSLDDVNVILENGGETQQLEPDSQGNLELPVNQLLEGENTVYATNGSIESNQETVSKQVPGNFLIDWNDLSNWDTIYSFDDFHYQHSRIWNQRQEWNEQKAYTDMINTLDSEGKKNTYHNDWSPKHYYPEGIQTWTRSGFRNHNNVEDVLRFAAAATEAHQVSVIGIKNRSRENDEFSASVEQLINEVHPEDGYEQKVTTTHVNQVGHGTCIAYADTEDTDLKGDQNWWFIDTTTSAILPVQESENFIQNGYNPFVQGYQGDQATTEVGRRQEKVIAVGSLGHFIDRTNDQDRWDGYVTMSDPMLEFVYNEHIREQDGDVEPILDMMERAADYQRTMEDEVPATIIGDSWDSMEIAEGQELYDAAMDMNTKVTKDTAYDIMSGTA